jgi:hypothetical protein
MRSATPNEISDLPEGLCEVGLATICNVLGVTPLFNSVTPVIEKDSVPSRPSDSAV